MAAIAQLELAQACAHLIVESGLTDWGLARTKALREVGLTSKDGPPSDAMIIDAIREYHALYQPKEHAKQLAAQREEALAWMEFFEDFAPRLTGPVAEGWAHAQSAIVIELTPEDEKRFDIFVANEGIELLALPDRKDGRHAYEVIGNDWPLHLVVRGEHSRGRSAAREGRVKLNIAALRQLVDESLGETDSRGTT